MSKAASSSKPSSSKPKTAGEAAAAILDKIESMPEPFRAIARRLNGVIVKSAPALEPTLWYGMPAYAKDGKVICFFRADKYLTFGLTENANHDLKSNAPHQLRESAWFLNSLDEATEAKLAAIVRKAAR